MRRALTICLGLAVLCIGGCTTHGVVPSKPKNLFQRIVTFDWTKNPVEKVEQAREGDEGAKTALLHIAHEGAFATDLAVARIPDGPERQVAAKFSTETVGALDVALGALEPGRKSELLTMLDGLYEQPESKPGLVAQAEFIRWKSDLDETATVKRAWEADRLKWEGESSQWGKERDAVASKWERRMFWFWMCVGGYVLIAWVLPMAAKLVPALRGVSTFTQGIIAPGMTMAYRSTRKLLGDVVSGVEDMRKKALVNFPEAKKAADAAMREWVTEADGTAAAVDAIRREENLM